MYFSITGQQPPSASEQNLKPQPVLDDKTRATEASTSIKTNGLHPPSRISPAASPAKPRGREASAILESFPLLNFMQSQILLMPEHRNGQ
jgi:hypothetical protein